MESMTVRGRSLWPRKLTCHRLLVLVLLLHAYYNWAAADGCVFPPEWRGSWIEQYYSPNFRMTFTRNEIVQKGVCHSSKPDGGRYVLYRASEETGQGCYFCIVFTPRTENILQYKESLDEQMQCSEVGANQMKPVSINGLCGFLAANERMHTMVREHTVPVPCPFIGQYTLEYRMATTNWCNSSPPSVAISCASDTQQLWNFPSCPDVVGLGKRNMQCIAHWPDNWQDNENWLYVKLNAIGDNDITYRCIRYQQSSDGQLMLYVSDDSTCMYISNDNTVPLTIRLTSSMNYPYTNNAGGCEFPQWLSSTTWTDLSGHQLYSTDERRLSNGASTRLRTIRQMTSPGNPIGNYNETTSISRCLTWIGDKYVTEVKDACKVQYQCLEMQKMVDGVAILTRGSYKINKEEVCSGESGEGPGIPELIFDASKQVVPCPFSGAYTFQSSSCLQAQVFQVGCMGAASDSSFLFELCGGEGEKSYQCLAAWRNNGKRQLLIGSRSGRTRGATVTGRCYSYLVDSTSGRVALKVDESCNNMLPSLALDPLLAQVIDLRPLRAKGACHISPNTTSGVPTSAASKRMAAPTSLLVMFLVTWAMSTAPP